MKRDRLFLKESHAQCIGKRSDELKQIFIITEIIRVDPFDPRHPRSIFLFGIL